MVVRLDPQSPVPLYHQIAETLRYQLATGQLRAGDSLPTLREAARRWGVNLHTVRRAYGELARVGLIFIRRPHGAQVTGVGTGGSSSVNVAGLREFLAETVERARERFGLTPSRLSELLITGSMGREAARESSMASFVECSELQAADYANQVAARWSVTVRAWSMDAEGEPPPGPIVSTYFHYNEVRSRWPGRHRDMRFVSVKVDPTLAELLSSRKRGSPSAMVVLAEVGGERARDVVGDLMGLLGSENYRIVTRVVRRPGALLKPRTAGIAVLFAPRLWSRLTVKERAHPKALQLRYVIEPSALVELGEAMGWRERDRRLMQVS